MATKVGALIKEARTAKGLTQEELARKISGISASDISKAERGEKDLTQDQLKQIAKLTGVTQASLINAAKGTTKKTTTQTSAKTTTTKKTTTAKATTAKTATAKTTTAKTTTAKTTAAKKTTTTGTSVKLTATEKKFVDAYRNATSDQRSAALRVLKGECNDLLTNLLGGSNRAADSVADLIGDALGKLLGQ